MARQPVYPRDLIDSLKFLSKVRYRKDYVSQIAKATGRLLLNRNPDYYFKLGRKPERQV